MTDVFTSDYSDIYDLLYRDKNYAEEVAYITRVLRSVQPKCSSLLELGCGTGIHGRLLSGEGFNIVGVDQSEGMLQRARHEQVPGVHYMLGDIQNIVVGRKFDAVVSLFHVISYMTSTKALLATFRNVREHLQAGGLFMFDFWYGPAVLTMRPTSKYKEAITDKLEVFRFSNTSVDVNKNLANVNYTLIVKDRVSGFSRKIEETHSMRYFFLPELCLFLEESGLRIIKESEWLTERRLGDATWNGYILAEAF